MSNTNCNCEATCGIKAIIASIIIGVIAAFLRITAVITVTPAFLWVLFGIAVVYLSVVLVTAALTRTTGIRRCLYSNLQPFIAGILGTILTSVILLGITFAATSIIGAIITGLLLLFFTLTITSTACLIKCITGCDYDDNI